MVKPVVSKPNKRYLQTKIFNKTSIIFIASMVFVQSSIAGSREQAKRMHDRLAGVPPSEVVLQAMQDVIANDVDGQGMLEAAYIAMDNPAFYSVTLKNIAAPWTNRDQDIFVPLNDYIATYIGLVRDGADIGVTNTSNFSDILSADTLYTGNVGLAYDNGNNSHYEFLDNNNIDLSSNANLSRKDQSTVTGLASSATAGVMTSRAAARAFFFAGTNRAMFRYTVLNHLCYDLEQLKDITRPADRIRQDISRTPGGDSRLFMNNCVGCHSGMDPMAQAFAYYQWDFTGDPDTGNLTYQADADGDGNLVEPKYFINATTFPHGYITPDNRWDNFWRKGINKNLLGFDENLPVTEADINFNDDEDFNGDFTTSGMGAASLGKELASSEAFARCHVQHAFKSTCLRTPADQNDIDEVARITGVFKANNYNLKRVFAETAAYCAGN